jgi:replicative DNA helicase
LRESGEIEQAADIVCGLYRPELYEKRDDLRGLAELLLLKHRGGKCPWYMNLLFRPEWTRFFTAYNGEPLYSEADRQELASEAYEEYAL